MFLDKNTFSTVIANSPLVSIDLVVLDKVGNALLGRRLNRPAKDCWFVLGGRVRKNESLSDAFKRLTLEEIGIEFQISQAKLIGPFDHFYHDNVFGEAFSTHYVAIAYVIQIDTNLDFLPLDIQHAQYQWFAVESLLRDPTVHLHTKWYFDSKYTSI